MIKVEYKGRLGNRMFQYALGRYLAETKGYALEAAALPFPRTSDRITGAIYLEPQERFIGHAFPFEKIIGDTDDRCILLNGYFQRVEYYLPYMADIRKWFEPAVWNIPDGLENVGDKDLLIYIRLGDYITCNVALTPEFYRRVIEVASPENIYIISDEPDHEFLKVFQRYNATIIGGSDMIGDFCAARIFKRVAISCSTFSWWAAVLADADEIYVPISDAGPWSKCSNNEHIPSALDLRINDPRFRYFYNAPTIYSGRISSGFRDLASVRPALSRSHKSCEAFWFL